MMHLRNSIFFSVLAAILAAVLAALPGCEVGPNYQRPSVEQPTAFKSQPETQPAPKLAAQWWRLYHDDELNRLVAMASTSNQDLRQAVARVDQARALLRLAATYQLPIATAAPQYSRIHTSTNQPRARTGQPFGISSNYDDWRLPLELSYEIDVWGRVRRSVEASAAQSAASTDDLAVVRLTVTTDVAADYYQLRSLDRQVQILQDTVTAYAEEVRVVRSQLNHGLVAPIDLYQAQAQLQATRAQARDAIRARADLEHALAILCGRAAPLFSVAANPLLDVSPPVVPAGLPGQLLTLRPDVAEAEQNIISFNAQVGVATAEFYPTFMLTGTAGFESVSARHLLDWQSAIASITPSVSVPIFEAGRLQANRDAVKAQYNQAVAAYVSQVLTAYADVENALTDLHALTDEVDHLSAAVKASQEYVRSARVQYKQGLVDYLIVIDAERTLLSNQLTLAQDVNQQMAASIHLINALGGGWATEGHQ